jgi:hypothetical protein
MWSYDLVQQGVLTGNGPADANAKRLLQADGWQPYSIKVGDTYYGYNRLDPFATIIGTAADLADKQSEMTEVQAQRSAAVLIGSIINNLDNKSFMSGISDVFAAVESAKRGQGNVIDRYIQQRAASVLVPAAVSQANQGADPVWRSVGEDSFVTGLVDAFENRIPGLSDNNAPVRDALGQESISAGHAVLRALSPIKLKNARNDPVIAAIRQSDASIGRLQRRIKLDGVKRKLSDAEWENYQKTAGDLTYRYISEEMAAEDWKDLSTEEQRKLIDTAKRDARKDARTDLFGEGADGTGSDEN